MTVGWACQPGLVRDCVAFMFRCFCVLKGEFIIAQNTRTYMEWGERFKTKIYSQHCGKNVILKSNPLREGMFGINATTSSKASDKPNPKTSLYSPASLPAWRVIFTHYCVPCFHPSTCLLCGLILLLMSSSLAMFGNLSEAFGDTVLSDFCIVAKDLLIPEIKSEDVILCCSAVYQTSILTVRSYTYDIYWFGPSFSIFRLYFCLEKTLLLLLYEKNCFVRKYMYPSSSTLKTFQKRSLKNQTQAFNNILFWYFLHPRVFQR